MSKVRMQSFFIFYLTTSNKGVYSTIAMAAWLTDLGFVSLVAAFKPKFVTAGKPFYDGLTPSKRRYAIGL